MRGLVKYARGPGNVAVREVPEPALSDGEVLVEIEATGICGSDLHILEDRIEIPIRVPVVMGHEFSGRIVDRGKDVSGLGVGDAVTAMPSVFICGACRFCRAGAHNLCMQRKSMGYWHHGSFAPRVSVPGRCVHRLPAGVGFRAAALAEPLACAVHAVTERTGVSAGDLVAIVGPGSIGLLCLQVVMAEGGRAVVLGTAVDQRRLELARRLGAEVIANVDDGDAVARVAELTEGYGADVVLECSGSPSGASLALELVRKQGKLTQVGLFGGPISMALGQVAVKEIRFTGSFGQRATSWRRALQLMARGAVDTGALITHDIPIDDWRRGFDLCARSEGIKVLLDVKER